MDINQDGASDIRDATAFGDAFGGDKERRLIDINCDGQVNVQDARAFGHQWNGTGDATQAWQGHRLPAKP